MCQSDRIHDVSRRTFDYFRSNMRILSKANVSRRCVSNPMPSTAHFIDLDNAYTMAQSIRTCVSSADMAIEGMHRMSENTSLSIQKYEAVLCATGGT